GGPAARRRRHVRVAVAGIVLLIVAGVLILIGSDDGPNPVAAACTDSNEEIATAGRVLVDDAGNPEAAAEGFLADAFVDLLRDRAAAVRALDPGDEVLALVDEWDAIADEL